VTHKGAGLTSDLGLFGASNKVAMSVSSALAMRSLSPWIDDGRSLIGSSQCTAKASPLWGEALAEGLRSMLRSLLTDRRS
jgi:hypothetical protein